MLSKTEIGHAVSSIFNMNQFRLDTADKLDKDKVEIIWNDRNIFRNGHFRNRIISGQRYIYGPNTFTVKYDSETIGNITQMKTNNWNYHKYNFSIRIVDNQPKAELGIVGADDYTQQFAFNNKTGCHH